MMDIEPRQFVYARTGNLSQTTCVDQELADKFMRISDLRRDIIIRDSNKKPDGAAVAVSSSTLAWRWRSVAPISELTKVVHRTKKYHRVETVDDQYHVWIHDQVIDHDIRRVNLDQNDYEQQYLSRIRREVKSAALEVLWSEKMGLHQQRRNWIFYPFYGSYISANLLTRDYLNAMIFLGQLICFIHPFINIMQNRAYEGRKLFLPPYINPKPWQKIFYPPVPVNKWILGRWFLTKHGNDLITTNPPESI